MISTTTPSRLGTPPFVSPGRESFALHLPISAAIKRRNVLLDRVFYDVGALTEKEVDFLVDQTNLEGSILVVNPRERSRANGVRKFENHRALRASPGKLLSRFSIAGVGSSDVGAAAFARTLANHYGEPVGAIVAGYGIADLLLEGFGGWFVLGSGNYLAKLLHDTEAESQAVLEALQDKVRGIDKQKAEAVAATITGSPDSTALLRLLLDDEREIKTVLGHSKGCLSIAWALQALLHTGAQAAIEKARAIRIITTGAAVYLPDGFDNSGQYLGTLDWFGAMNSRGAGNLYGLWLNQDIRWVPNAWHHVNTELPFHLSVSDVLKRDDASTN